MLLPTLQTLFTRDLGRLKTEIASYTDERNLWLTDKYISNSAGNLCLHLIGNLNTYIGKELGGTDYIRNREAEFSLKDIPSQELLMMIEDTISILGQTLKQIKDDDLQQEYPLLVLDKKTSTGYFLVHLATHLAYHLGQINYHRRLLDNTTEM